MTITIRKLVLSTFLAVGLLNSSASLANNEYADEPTPYPMFTPSNIKWIDAPTIMPAGVKTAILIGNSDKKGEFVIRRHFPANYELPAHKTNATEYLTVISGTLQLGVGDKLNKQASRALPAGSFVVLPKGMHVYAWTKEATVIQISGHGPMHIKFLNKQEK